MKPDQRYVLIWYVTYTINGQLLPKSTLISCVLTKWSLNLKPKYIFIDSWQTHTHTISAPVPLTRPLVHKTGACSAHPVSMLR